MAKKFRNDIEKRAYESTKKNIKLRESEKSSGQRTFSRGHYDIGDGTHRSHSGKLIKPKDGWVLRSGATFKNQDRFFKYGNLAAQRLWAKGYDWDRVTQEVAHLNESYWTKKKEREAERAKKLRDSRNMFKKVGKLTGLPIEKEFDQPLRTASKAFNKAIGRKVDKVAKDQDFAIEGAKKTGKTLYKGIEQIFRPYYGNSASWLVNAKDAKKHPVNYGRNMTGELAHHVLGIGVKGNWKAYKKGLALKQKTTGYDILDTYKPDASTATKIVGGLGIDIFGDPTTYAGIGLLKIPEKAISTVKTIKTASKLAKADVAAQAKVLEDLGLKARAFRSTQSNLEFAKRGIKPNTKLTATHWEQMLGEKVGKEYATTAELKQAQREVKQLHRDIKQVLRNHVRPGANKSRVDIDLALTRQLQHAFDTRTAEHAAKLNDEVLKEQFKDLPKGLRHMAAAEHLLKTTDPALQKQREAAARYIKLVKKHQGKEFRWSTNINGKDVPLPLGKQGVEQFYRDMESSIQPKHRLLAKSVEDALHGRVNMTPETKSFIDYFKSAESKGHVEKNVASSLEKVFEQYPALADKIKGVRYADADDDFMMAISGNKAGEHILYIDPKQLEDVTYDLQHMDYAKELEEYTGKKSFKNLRDAKLSHVLYKRAMTIYRNEGRIITPQEITESLLIHELGHVVSDLFEESKALKEFGWGKDVAHMLFPSTSKYGDAPWKYGAGGADDKFAEWFAARHHGEVEPHKEFDSAIQDILETPHISKEVLQALQDAGYKHLPDDAVGLSKHLRENNVPIYNSRLLKEGEQAPKHGIDLKDLSPSYLTFYDKIREANKGYGIAEGRLDRELALHDYKVELNAELMQDLMDQARKAFESEAKIIQARLDKVGITPAERTALMRQYNLLKKEFAGTSKEIESIRAKAKEATDAITDQIKAGHIISSMSRKSDRIKIGLSLRVMGHDVLKISDPFRIAERASSMPVIKQGTGLWRKGFENFDKFARHTNEADLLHIRNVRLGGPARVFQGYAKEYHHAFDGINAETRKLQLKSLRDALRSGTKPKDLTGRDKEIYNLFEPLVHVASGKMPIGDSVISMNEFLTYLPKTFEVSKGVKSIKSVEDLIDALGTGVQGKIDQITKHIDELNEAVKLQRGGHLTKKIKQLEHDYRIADSMIAETSSMAEKAAATKLQQTARRWQEYQDLIKAKGHDKVLKDEGKVLKRLLKSKADNVVDDPLQALWATRIAAEQAAGWRGLTQDIATRFGIKISDEKIGQAIKLDEDAADLIKNHGWKSFDQIDGYIFDPDTAKNIEKLLDLFKATNVRRTVDFFDRATRAWKVTATLYNPGYYTRNMVGEITAGWFGGVNNPVYYERAGRILLNTREGSMLEHATRNELFGIHRNPQLIQAAKSHAPYTDLMTGKFGPDKSRVVATTKNGEKITLNQFVTMYLENNLITNFVNTEFHEIGSNIAGVSKLGKYPKRFIHEPLRALGEVGENFPRMAHFLHGLEHAPANLSHQEAGRWAAGEVRKYHFDYSDITPFERAVMTRVIPFYKWTRKAMPMVVESLLERPGKLAAYPKIMNSAALSQNEDYNRNGFLPIYDDNVPNFIQQMIAYPVGIDAEGNETYLNINTPGFEGLKALTGLGSTAQLMLNPLIKTPLEQLYGEKFNEQFDKDGMDKRQRLSEVLSQIPATKEIDETVRRGDWKKDKLYDPEWSEPGAPIDEAGLSYLSGATALEVKKPFEVPKMDYEKKTWWGKYRNFGRQFGEAKDDGIKLPDSAYTEFNLMRREHPERFPKLKHLTDSIDAKGNLDFNKFQYYNKWTSPYAKYIRKNGNRFVMDWDAVNRDRANGKLEQATPEELAADEKARLKRIAKRKKG